MLIIPSLVLVVSFLAQVTTVLAVPVPLNHGVSINARAPPFDEGAGRMLVKRSPVVIGPRRDPSKPLPAPGPSHGKAQLNRPDISPKGPRSNPGKPDPPSFGTAQLVRPKISLTGPRANPNSKPSQDDSKKVRRPLPPTPDQHHEHRQQVADHVKSNSLGNL